MLSLILNVDQSVLFGRKQKGSKSDCFYWQKDFIEVTVRESAASALQVLYRNHGHLNWGLYCNITFHCRVVCHTMEFRDDYWDSVLLG